MDRQFNRTPLHDAAQSGATEIVESLLKFGAKTYPKDTVRLGVYTVQSDTALIRAPQYHCSHSSVTELKDYSYYVVMLPCWHLIFCTVAVCLLVSACILVCLSVTSLANSACILSNVRNSVGIKVWVRWGDFHRVHVGSVFLSARWKSLEPLTRSLETSHAVRCNLGVHFFNFPVILWVW